MVDDWTPNSKGWFRGTILGHHPNGHQLMEGNPHFQTNSIGLFMFIIIFPVNKYNTWLHIMGKSPISGLKTICDMVRFGLGWIKPVLVWSSILSWAKTQLYTGCRNFHEVGWMAIYAILCFTMAIDPVNSVDSQLPPCWIVSWIPCLSAIRSSVPYINYTYITTVLNWLWHSKIYQLT